MSLGAFLILIVVAVFAYAITDVSYWRVANRAHEGMMFIGQLANHENTNAAFSFIRQAAKGRLLFANIMTDQETAPVYINLQFWVMGKLLPFLGWRTHLLFRVWRFLGVLALALGCALLDRAVLPNVRHRLISRTMCLFGGGLGAYAISLHPFGQMYLNPLLAVPQGLWLAVIACMVIGEQRGRAVWYVAAACLAAVRGLCGPHDLFPMFLIVAAFTVTEGIYTGRFDWRLNALRQLPLLACIPVVLYYLHLHRAAPTFTEWMASWYPPTPVPHWLILGYGVAGVLLILRVALLRKFPASTPASRLLLIAALAPMGFALLFPLRAAPLPVGAPSVVPAIVVAVSLLEFPSEVGSKTIRPLQWVVGACLIASVIPSALLYTKVASINTSPYSNFMSKAEYLTFATLNQDTKSDDVIAAPLPMSNLFGQFVDARTVVGHPVLTPDANELLTPLNAFLRGEMSVHDASSFIAEHRIRVIYTQVGDGSAGPEYFETIPGVHASHDSEGITVYSVETENDSGQDPLETGATPVH
ncbi:MAG: hypothetical protein K1Y02_22545 [Candidatus Hydrogenedentes bacterium]|nr:hypothetical protein [Candidatus Hydrogenedentota bacterium]